MSVRAVDMNVIPADLGQSDIIWSACAFEHLGSPQAGLNFVLESCKFLKPGGIAIHTTERELTVKDRTQDYGNCAVYRIEDLQCLADELHSVGCSTEVNTYVSMDSSDDRWISLAIERGNFGTVDGAHLRLAIGDSVSTSFGLLIRKEP